MENQKVFIVCALNQYGPGIFGAYNDYKYAKIAADELNNLSNDLDIKFVVIETNLYS